MTRRRAPRPASPALRAALEQAAPKTRLGAVQSVWDGVVGDGIAAVTEPLAEREGTIVIGCADPVWAQELDLMQAQLLDRLKERLGDEAPESLQFRLKTD